MLARVAFGLLMCAGFGSAVQACNVPVFRYALERWPAEPFHVVIFYRGTLEAEQQTLTYSLEKTQFANIEVTTLDLDSKLDPLLEKVWKQETNAALPWTVILPPHGDETPVPLWSGHLTRAIVTQLIDSPLRRELAKRLLRGDSAVWLLLESEDKAANDRVAELLTQEVAKQEKEIKLPPPDPDDPQMHANLSLRVAFSVMRASRNDPSEAFFYKMLLHGESVPANEPTVFPIFARGRVLAALSGSKVTAKIIHDASTFICGACSCEVKELNPGKDLLLAANWNSIFGSPKQAPAVVGNPVIATNVVASFTPARGGPPKTEFIVSVTPPSRRVLLLIGIVVAAALVVITGAMLFARPREK